MTKRSPSLIADRLGHAEIKRLSALVGGSHITIPDTLRPHPLSLILDDGLFALLVFHFAGTRLYVPTCQDRKTFRVDAAAVARLTKRGWSARRIAKALQCSDRTVYAKRALLRSRASTKSTN